MSADALIAVVGAGSWGTALAVHLARAGAPVRLWAREAEVVAGIRETRRNPWYLSDIEVPTGVEVTDQLETVASDAELLLVVVPSEFFASTLAGLGPLPKDVPMISATKGFDPERHLRMTDLLRERFPQAAVAALSGPTFAREVALGLPTAAVIAARDDALAARLQARVGTREFRVYVNRDVVGVEAGGALKNVMAIATGLAEGLGLGQNARAALITRGLAEMTRLAAALGGRADTMAGLAGIGDLVLTCTGELSRNRGLGIELARGRTAEQVEKETRMIAEGVRTVRSALVLADRHGVAMPICEQVGGVLFAGRSPSAALGALLERPPAREDH